MHLNTNLNEAKLSRTRALLIGSLLGLSLLAACNEPGPMEKAGEALDEAGHTIKNGGKETTADKIDDKFDAARDKVNDAVK